MFLATIFDQLKKQTPCRREFKGRKKEGERTVAKTRSVCLISASLNKGQSSHFGAGVSNVWENPQMDSVSAEGAAGNCRRNSVEGAAGNCRQDNVYKTVQNSKTYSQVWKGDNQSQRSCGKLQHCAHDHVTHDGRSCGDLQQDNAQGAVPDSSQGPRETAGRTQAKATWLKVRSVSGNCNERLKSNCRRPTTTCKSQIMGTLRKSSRIFVEN